MKWVTGPTWLWGCAVCGAVAGKQARLLLTPCAKKPAERGNQFLGRLARGLHPWLKFELTATTKLEQWFAGL
eukprot:8255079-Prorocentrum_lima.AAC.1